MLYPLMIRLPVLGWDWYFFFNAHNPVDNIYSPLSPFFPYTRYIIQLFTWMPWRDSLAILAGMTYMALALGTWVSGGKYGSIAMALFTPLPIFVLWVGHPDGLALAGMITGIIPLALIKPQITFWSFLRNKAFIFWLVITFGLIFLLWPGWLPNAFRIHWDHSGSFGWQALGWPLIIIGVIFLAGAGNDPWKLMASGCFLTPDLMVYHIIVLLPAIGKAPKWWKGVVWVCAWLILLGTGFGGYFRYIDLLFPLSIYLSLQTPQNYKKTLLGHISTVRGVKNWILQWI